MTELTVPPISCPASVTDRIFRLWASSMKWTPAAKSALTTADSAEEVGCLAPSRNSSKSVV